MTTLLRATHTLASDSTYFAYVRREGDERDTTCAARVNTAFTQNWPTKYNRYLDLCSLEIRFDPFRLGANRSDRREKLRRGTSKHRRPIPYLTTLVNIDESTIYETHLL